MFFILSKTLDLLLAPLTWVFLLAGLGAWSAYRNKPRRAVRALGGAGIVLYLFSLPPVANAIVRALESSATSTMVAGKTYDVVVVLGGMSDANEPSPLGSPEFGERVDRILAGYDLVRRDQARNILITADPEEGPALGKQLADWGVAPERIAVEAKSANTRDNAVGTARILRERGWSQVLLVTSALHMPRAEGCFRAVGLSFDTLAVDRLAVKPGRVWWHLEPRAEALGLSTGALREGAGRLVYRVVGYAR